jgi:hypothetical protein
MTTDKLLHIIEQGENEIVEFKTSYSKIVNLCSAFIFSSLQRCVHTVAAASTN